MSESFDILVSQLHFSESFVGSILNFSHTFCCQVYFSGQLIVFLQCHLKSIKKNPLFEVHTFQPRIGHRVQHVHTEGEFGWFSQGGRGGFCFIFQMCVNTGQMLLIGGSGKISRGGKHR